MQRIEVDSKYLTFKHPFTCMIAGPTSSGKTFLVRNILKHHRFTLRFKDEIETLQVLWSYGHWQNLYEKEVENCNINYTEGLPSAEYIREINPNVIIIDDLMS